MSFRCYQEQCAIPWSNWRLAAKSTTKAAFTATESPCVTQWSGNLKAQGWECWHESWCVQLRVEQAHYSGQGWQSQGQRVTYQGLGLQVLVCTVWHSWGLVEPWRIKSQAYWQKVSWNDDIIDVKMDKVESEYKRAIWMGRNEAAVLAGWWEQRINIWDSLNKEAMKIGLSWGISEIFYWRWKTLAT